MSRGTVEGKVVIGSESIVALSFGQTFLALYNLNRPLIFNIRPQRIIAKCLNVFNCALLCQILGEMILLVPGAVAQTRCGVAYLYTGGGIEISYKEKYDRSNW